MISSLGGFSAFQRPKVTNILDNTNNAVIPARVSTYGARVCCVYRTASAASNDTVTGSLKGVRQWQKKTFTLSHKM
jgi:hypothetical protein